MLETSFEQLDSDFREFYQEFGEFRIKELSLQLRDSPTQYTQYPDYDFTNFHFKTNKKKDLIFLSILSWYFPEDIRIIFQLSLEEHWAKIDSLSVERKILLTSKAFALAWCLLIGEWNDNDFYGNYLSKKKKFIPSLFKMFNFKRLSSKRVKRYTGYCRGYPGSHRRVRNSVPPELRVETLSEEELIIQKLEFNSLVESISNRIEDYLSRL
jgi:hypothetical protein